MSDAPIYKNPEDLLFDLGIASPNEIDVYAIAKFCKAQVVEKILHGIEARIIGNGKEAFITVNSNSSEERKRFSIGHELGHWMFDRGKPFFNCSNLDLSKWDLKSIDPEVRANQYSSNLIMPKSMFVPVSKKKPLTFSTVKELASLFNTSLTATSIKLIELGSYPSMLICTENGKRKWFCRSQIIPEDVWPVEMLQKDSLAADLLNTSSKEKAGQVSADCWITVPGSEDYIIYESSISLNSNTILSIIWWKDETQISELIAADDEENE
jgi:hypothetical protein